MNPPAPTYGRPSAADPFTRFHGKLYTIYNMAPDSVKCMMIVARFV